MKTKVLLLLMAIIEFIIVCSMDYHPSFWIKYLHLILFVAVFVIFGMIIENDN